MTFKKGHTPWHKGKKTGIVPKTAFKKGIISWNKGKKLSKKSKEKISEANKGNVAWNKGLVGYKAGKEHYNWKDGKSFEPYDKKFNNLFKNNIRKRDNQVCMLCKIHREKLRRALIVHHINYDKLLTVPQNCISLCDCCHGKTNHNREFWITFLQSILNKKYGYIYENQKIILEVKK